MAPGIHPPCTPSASCQPPRCHPTPPPCADPERCIAETTRKNVKPCASAVSILATRSHTKCSECNRLKIEAANVAGNKKKKRKKNDTRDPSTEAIRDYLDRKSMEAKLRREDRLMGTHKYTEYRRKIGTPRSATDCCAGHGHRGRLSRDSGKKGRCCSRDGGNNVSGKKKKGRCIIL